MLYRLKNVFEDRPKDAKKGDFGRVLIIGGSKMFTGAPALSALAALYTGCDLTVIAAPKRAADICAAISPNLITQPLDGDFLKNQHIKEIKPLIDKADAIVIGPGLGQEEETKKTIIKLLEYLKKPTVIDADAITAIIQKKETFKNRPFILTPHRGEFKKLTGKEVTEENVQLFAKKLGCVILAKGPKDIISNGKKIEKNNTGNSYMTVGGTGDVLSGITAALLARGVTPFDAAMFAAYIMGRAGDIAALTFGESLTATDILDIITQVLLEVNDL
ncbi:NAD(P)H-hydrate dehydratase [archaeon]|nr:NAD(P)H-hydrate dehydratase [archaeon]